MPTGRDDIRQRISLLRFVLIVGLVFLHYGSFPGSEASPFGGCTDRAPSAAFFINSWLLFFFYSAVPLLSLISGYLFFKDDDGSRRFYLERYRNRTRSILLPMISWNAIVLAIFGAIALASPSSPLRGIVTYDVMQLTPARLANAILGITRHPINNQFWFLRDLFLTVLCTPALGWLMRRAPWAGAAALGTAWVLGFNFFVFFRTDVLFFFYMGGLFRLRFWRLNVLSVRAGLAIMAAYALLTAARTIAPAFLTDGSLASFVLLDVGTRLLRVVGIAAFWASAPLLVGTALGQALIRVSGLAFFLHAVHWPLNQFVKSALAALLPTGNDAWLLVNYAATIAVTVALAFALARALHVASPRFLKHLCGGRELPETRRAETPQQETALATSGAGNSSRFPA